MDACMRLEVFMQLRIWRERKKKRGWIQSIRQKNHFFIKKGKDGAATTERRLLRPVRQRFSRDHRQHDYATVWREIKGSTTELSDQNTRETPATNSPTRDRSASDNSPPLRRSSGLPATVSRMSEVNVANHRPKLLFDRTPQINHDALIRAFEAETQVPCWRNVTRSAPESLAVLTRHAARLREVCHVPCALTAHARNRLR